MRQTREEKNLEKCTHQWTTNDETNKQALSTLSVFARLKRKDRQQQKEQRSGEEDGRGGNQTGPLAPWNGQKLPGQLPVLPTLKRCCSLGNGKDASTDTKRGRIYGIRYSFSADYRKRTANASHTQTQTHWILSLMHPHPHPRQRQKPRAPKSLSV